MVKKYSKCFSLFKEKRENIVKYGSVFNGALVMFDQTKEGTAVPETVDML